MKYTVRRSGDKSLFCCRDNIIFKVNKAFVDLCGYSEEEVMGKSLFEIGRMIRIDSQICLEDIKKELYCCIFTKHDEPREIKISCSKLYNGNEKTYCLNEIPHSRMDESMPYSTKLLADNEIGFAILRIPDLIVLKVNQKFMNAMDEKYTDKMTCLGRKLTEILPYGYCGNKVLNTISEIINTGKIPILNDSVFDPFKSRDKYYNFCYFPIFLFEKSKHILMAIFDITEKVMRKKLIEEQKIKLEAIIDNISDELIICDKNGQYGINKAFRNNPLFSDTDLENLEREFEIVQHFDKDGKLIPLGDLPIKRIIRGEKISGFPLDIKKEDLTIHREVNGTPIYDSEGNFIAGVLISRDIGDRIKNEENLLIKAQFDLSNQIIENLEFCFARCSYPDFKILDFNNIAYNYLLMLDPNLKSHDIIDHYLYDIVKVFDKEALTKDIAKYIEEKHSTYSQVRMFNKSGTGIEKYYRIMWQPLFGLENQVMQVIAIAIDITDDMIAKNKVEEALKIQDEIFANVSHELKTPLNVIFSTSQLLESYLKSDSLDACRKKVSKSIKTIKQNCYRFTKLINNIVDLSKMDSGFLKLNLENENIVEITDNIVQSVSEYVKAKELAIIFDTDTEEKIIACDPEKIERIILNLISNAIKFTNTGGTIYVNFSDKDDHVEISVRDTGIGIERKYLESIFKRFHQVDKTLTRNTEGSGIGLSLVKSIIDMHGGKISVDSEVGKGSIFKVELPVRIVDYSKDIEQSKPAGNKVEMIKIEFSDIYNL